MKLKLPAVNGSLLLQDTSSIFFNLQQSILQDVNISIFNKDYPSVGPVVTDSNPPDTKWFKGLSVTDTVVVQDLGNVLYNSGRFYELTPVIWSMDHFEVSPSTPSDFILSTVFVPQENSSVADTPMTNFLLLSANQNTIFSLNFTKSVYYVSLQENIVNNIGTLLLQIVLVVAAVKDCFEVLVLVVEFFLEGKDWILGKLHKKEKKEEEDETKRTGEFEMVSPRGFLKTISEEDREEIKKFNPYKVRHIKALIEFTIAEHEKKQHQGGGGGNKHKSSSAHPFDGGEPTE